MVSGSQASGGRVYGGASPHVVPRGNLLHSVGAAGGLLRTWKPWANPTNNRGEIRGTPQRLLCLLCSIHVAAVVSLSSWELKREKKERKKKSRET